MRRDVAFERDVIATAALSIGQARVGDGGTVVDPVVDALNAYSEARAWPGEVVIDGRPVPLVTEVAQELADARSYLLWIIQCELPAAEAGDSDASEAYGRAMRSLAIVLEAWKALVTH